MAVGGLTDSMLARSVFIIGLTSVIIYGAKSIWDASHTAMAQELRDLQASLRTQFGGAGNNYTTVPSEDVTLRMIRARVVAENLIDRSTNPPTLRHRDDGGITLTLQPTTRSVTYTNLREQTCITLVTSTDLGRDLRQVVVGGLTADFGVNNPPDAAQLRQLADACANGATVTWRWGIG